MKIGINGGSFNPVHNGHIKLCREFLSLVPLDRIFMIPVSFPPHKQVSFLASGEDRMNMLRLALEDEKNIEPCGMELRRGGKSYTVDTVNAFEKIYPDGEFFLIMGADMFLTLEEWKDAGTLIEKCGICTAARDDAEVEGLLEHAEKIGVSRERLYVSDMEKDGCLVYDDSKTGRGTKEPQGGMCRKAWNAISIPIIYIVRRDGRTEILPE